jgi:hypothetical protein
VGEKRSLLGEKYHKDQAAIYLFFRDSWIREIPILFSRTGAGVRSEDSSLTVASGLHLTKDPRLYRNGGESILLGRAKQETTNVVPWVTPT